MPKKQTFRQKQIILAKATEKLLKNYTTEMGFPFTFAFERTPNVEEAGIQTIVHIGNRKYELYLKPIDEIQYEYARAKVTGKLISRKIH